MDAVDGRNDVGAGLAANFQKYRGSIAMPGGKLDIFHAFDRRAHVSHAYRRSVAIGENRVPIGLGIQQLVIRSNRVRLPASLDAALWSVDIGLLDGGPDSLQAQSQGSQRRGAYLNAHRPFLPALDRNKPHPVELRQLR